LKTPGALDHTTDPALGSRPPSGSMPTRASLVAAKAKMSLVAV
jgi:hypothetical protein